MFLRWKIAQWFELKWWQHYLRGKDKTEYLAWKKAYWLNVFEKIQGHIKIEANQTIADLGCGPAGVFIALPQNPVTAIDPLLNQYESQTTFFNRADYKHTQFVQSTIEEFTAANKFDIVFCMNAINHVRDIEKGFTKVKQVCANNGTIIVSIDAHNFSFFKYLFRLIPGDILHPHQYDLAEYKNFMAADGWKITGTVLLKRQFFFDHYLMVGKMDFY